jgi:hypothetical protein
MARTMTIAENRPQLSSVSFSSKRGSYYRMTVDHMWSSGRFFSRRGLWLWLTVDYSDHQADSSQGEDDDYGWQSTTVIIRQLLFKSRTMALADSWTDSDHQAEDLQVEDYGFGWQLNRQWSSGRRSSSRGLWLWLTVVHICRADSRSQWSSGVLLFKSRTMTTADSWTQWWSCSFFFKVYTMTSFNVWKFIGICRSGKECCIYTYRVQEYMVGDPVIILSPT